MFKKLIVSMTLAVMLISGTPVMAAGKPDKAKVVVTDVAQKPVMYEERITVTKEGGSFKIGFVTLDFKKEFLPKEQLPARFNVKVYAMDGQAGIEITPDTEKFLKNVLIKTDKYDGYLYDKTIGKNIYFSIKHQTIVARHFSWYRFR